MRVFDIKKIFTNIVCIVIVIIGIITCSHVLSYDLSETFISNDVIDNYNNSNVTFAIYVENDAGEYEEYSNSSFPTNMVYNEDYSGCTDYDGNVLSGILSYEDGVASVNTEVTTYCTLYFDVYLGYCIENGITNLGECVIKSESQLSNLEYAKAYIKSKGTPTLNKVSTTDEGLYYAEDDYGDSYYFRGAVTDNYVAFAGYIWRIIRVNGDGSVRMIYDGTYAHDNGDSSKDRLITNYSSEFNTNDTASIFVGYMYGDVQIETASKTITLEDRNYYYGTEYELNPDTGYYTLTGDVIQTIWNSDLEGYYTCAPLSTSCTTMYKIDSYYSNYQAIVYTYTKTGSAGSYVESISSSTSTRVMASLDVYSKTYTFYSATGQYRLTNWSSEVWNGDGSLVGYYTCGSSKILCNELYYITSVNSDTDANVIHYTDTGGTYSEITANKNDSPIKDVLDSWYLSNIVQKTDGTYSYASYISDTLFCNDRSIYSGTGVGRTETTYNSWYRVANMPTTVTLKCSQKNDSFTVKDIAYGNGALTHSVGLITADEIVMAGGKYGTANYSYYLYNGNISFSMTPTGYLKVINMEDTYSAGVAELSNNGSIQGGGVANSANGIKPVINLSSSVVLTGGDGTMDNPYQVSLS